ncbi:MAG: hypothetical protein ACRD1K_13400, partial [Acidimicrobiales bacterium]
VRWDGLKGSVIGMAQAGTREQGGEFVTQVRIPKDAPGIHYVVVVSGGQGGWSRAAFKIPGKPGDPGLAAGNAVDRDGLTGPSTDPMWYSRPQTAGSSDPALVAGVAMLSVGMVALVGGFAVAGARRNRARASRQP